MWGNFSLFTDQEKVGLLCGNLCYTNCPRLMKFVCWGKEGSGRGGAPGTKYCSRFSIRQVRQGVEARNR